MVILRWAILIVSLTLLNVSLTFGNIWPTLGVQLSGDLSVELAICVLSLVLARVWFGVPSYLTLRWLAVLWVVLMVGHYIDETAKSLYGRDINLYWDLRHMPNIGAMFVFVASAWHSVALVIGVVLIPVVLYVLTRWAFECVSEATKDSHARWILGGTTGGILLLSVAQSIGAPVPSRIHFAEPVTAMYAREVGELAYEMTGVGVRDLGPQPPIESDFTRVSGADVFLIFLESYGAVSWDRPEFVESLASSRTRFEVDISETGRSVVSAFVKSTTFGGESWLAHISLLSGTEVRDEGTNVRLLAQNRDTLVKAFGRHGYRTVAMMPGLLLDWPQGAFYGFDEIYDLARLDYQGPTFGWWDINDQFVLARMDALEVATQPRRPLFVFFPTITTHAPFVPTPPYQPDWARVLTTKAYDPADVERAWADYSDWLNLGPSYVKGLTYAYTTVGGYLRLRADRDLVMILVGDHQPPALVSGESASWDVPVHVIANRRGLLDRLLQHRFHEGLRPQYPAVAQMDTLLPLLLDAFGDDEEKRR